MSDNEKIPLYLHVGFHKTGSTAIQKFLMDNRERLLNKGYLYPITKENPHGHHVFAYAVANAIFPRTGVVPDKIKLAQALIEEVENTHPKAIIISSENFKGSNDEKMMAEAREFFSCFDVKIIIYVRRQDEFFQALYQERIKPPRSITKKINEIQADYEMSYYVRVSSWAKYFGKENVILRVFEKEKFVGGNLFADFLDAAGLELTSEYLIPQGRVNSSMGPKLTEMVRLSNNFDVKDRYKFVHFLRSIYENTSQTDQGLSFLSKQDREAILSRYLMGNERLAKEYLGWKDSVLFNCEVGDDESYSESIANVDSAEVMELLIYTWNHYLQNQYE